MMDQRVEFPGKYPPPTFMKTPLLTPESMKRWNRDYAGSGSGRWTLPTLKYGKCSIILANDISNLQELIKLKRDEGQIARENFNQTLTLNLTEQLPEQACNWRVNALHQKFKKFNSAFPASISDGNVNVGGGGGHLIFMPSFSWLQYMIYMVLGDAVHLSKMKLKAEMVMRHWVHPLTQELDDSLLFTSIVGRMWYLSGLMLEELNSKIYPELFRLTCLIQPVQGLDPWPRTQDSDSWKVPNPEGSFVDWLKETFSLSLESVNVNKQFLSIAKKNNLWMMGSLVIGNVYTATATTGTLSSGAAEADRPDSKQSEGLAAAKKLIASLVIGNSEDGCNKGGLGPSAVVAGNKRMKIKTEPEGPKISKIKTEPIASTSGSSSKKVRFVYAKESENENSSEDESSTSTKRLKSDTKNETSQDNRRGAPPPGQIMNVKQFENFWEQIFSKALQSDPKSLEDREMIMAEIERYNSLSQDSFSPRYWNEFLKYKPYLDSLEQVVGFYAGSPSITEAEQEMYITNLKKIRGTVRTQVKKISKKSMPRGKRIKKQVKKDQKKNAKRRGAQQGCDGGA